MGGVTLKGQGMAIVDEVSVQHLPHPSLSDEKSEGGAGQGEPVSARQRAEWAQFDQRWGRELELQHETDMEFFRWTRDGQALPAAGAVGVWQRAGVAVSVTVQQQPGTQLAPGGEDDEEKPEDGGEAEKSRKVVLPGRNGWAEPEVPLGVLVPPGATGNKQQEAPQQQQGPPPSPALLAAAERHSKRRSSAARRSRAAAA